MYIYYYQDELGQWCHEQTWDQEGLTDYACNECCWRVPMPEPQAVVQFTMDYFLGKK